LILEENATIKEDIEDKLKHQLTSISRCEWNRIATLCGGPIFSMLLLYDLYRDDDLSLLLLTVCADA
jgi:hypothetical protein